MTIPIIAKFQKAFVGDEGLVDAVDTDLDATPLTGGLANTSDVQQALQRIDGTGLGAAPRTFQNSFISSSGNQDTWYGGQQTVYLIGQSSTNENRVYELPDIDELNAIFDDMVSRGLGEVYTLTVEYRGGNTSSIVRNSMTIRPANVSPLFDRNELPVTIGRGAMVTFRITRTGASIGSWERVAVGQSVDPVATFGELALQTRGWSNRDGSLLPLSDAVLKGYAFPVVNSIPNDGTLRQGLIDSGVSDRLIYDGDYVVWTADAFTAWTNGDDWFVLNRDSLQRLTREQSNFLSQTSEIDNRVDVGLVNQMSSNALVWLSENPLAEAPFLTPSTDPNNPRSGDDYAYIGGQDNVDGLGRFQFGQNRFNSFITIGISPNFITANPESNIYIRIRDTDNNVVESFNLATDFTFRNDSDFTNSTVRHYTRSTSINYAFLETIEIWLTEIQAHFRMNPNSVDATANIAQNGITEPLLSADVQTKLNANLTPQSQSFAAIEDRLSPYKTLSFSEPDIHARFLSASASTTFPSDISTFSQVAADNPRFTTTDVVLFVATPEPGNFSLRNNNADTVVALDQNEATVDVIESVNVDGTTFFVYRVTGIISGNRYEVERVTTQQVVAWPDDIDNLQDDIRRIDAELEHALLGLSDEVVQVLENELTVKEEDTPSVVSTAYNNSLGDTGTQTVFFETNPVAPSGGAKTSKPIKDTSGTDRTRRKLVYFPEGTTFANQTYLHAFDEVTTRDLIRYENGVFNARVRVPAVPAGVRTETIYPAPSNRVSGNGIWINIPALTFVNGVPVPEADEVFFTRNVPTTAATITIQYRGRANGNIFGTSSTTLAGVGGGSDVLTNFTLDDGGEQAFVEVLYRASQRDIRVSVTEHVSAGLPTINDIEVILSYTESRDIPAVPASTRNVPIENVHTGAQVFAIKPSATNTLILVGDQTEIDTGWQYTTLFGAVENGHLAALDETAQFFDYEDFDPIATTITDLENHATLPQFGLFTTQYTHETIVELATQLTVTDSTGTVHNVGEVLTDLLARVTALEP